MSDDPTLQTLLRAPGEAEQEDVWLEEIIQKELDAILASMPDRHGTSCLLHDLGNYLMRTTTLLARLSDRIVNGDEVHKYCDERIVEMEVENDFSDLGSLNYMAEKHTTLKSVNSRLQTTAVELNAVWGASGTPPFHRRRDCPPSDSSVDTAVTDSASTASPTTVYSTWQVQQSPVKIKRSRTGSSGQSTSPSYMSPTSGEQQANHDAVDRLLKSLTVRGTGKHTCPYGMSCTKGGLRDGELLVFERNSAFRAHLQKHEKIHVCQMPGCTAKGGFARIDQLRRHMQTVPHNAKR